jgi:beta propeller repeat protein
VSNQSVWSDDVLTFTIDAIDPDGDAVSYSASTLPSGATFANKTFDWTPTQAQMGTYNVTFYASDGQLQDSQAINISVNVDSQAPTVTNLSPAPGAIQVPLNNLITLNITDAGKGIDPTSVKIKLKINNNPNINTVYTGDTNKYISSQGDCQRIGSNDNYKLVFQTTKDSLYYDQTITVTVDASDLAGNVMNTYTYSFVTEMHLFGQNKSVTNLDNNDKPLTVCDSNGDIWAVWHSGSTGSRDIYISKLAAGSSSFGSTIQITNDTADQCNPAIALDSNDKLYVVWQDNRNGDWDIYISTSVDGIKWSTETMINNPNKGNQINPTIVIDNQLTNFAHIVWQDDNSGNQDIYIATSSNDFLTKTITQITSDVTDQIEPAVAVDSANTIYVVWTDNRNSSSDIYGAASNSGPWSNVTVINNTYNQSSPVIATEATGTILHLLWIDDTPGDNDIYYASSNNGFQGISSGTSIIDDTSGADQLEPTITTTGSTSTNDLKVFACWQDFRNTDTDIYFTELSAGSGTNVFVNDGGSNAPQSDPAIGIDENGHPYLMWADDRNANTNIYFTGSTYTELVALASSTFSASSVNKTIVGVDPKTIANVDDVSVELPSGACTYDVDISIVPITNRQEFATPCLGSFEFDPSGIQFDKPVTITIPYAYSSSNSSVAPYWFNSQSGSLSQQGITNIRDIEISPTLHAVCFETTHFTPYYVFGGGGGISGIFGGGGGGGGGGCSLSYSQEGSILEYFLPYGVLALFMLLFKLKDKRNKTTLGDVSTIQNIQ